MAKMGRRRSKGKAAVRVTWVSDRNRLGSGRGSRAGCKGGVSGGSGEQGATRQQATVAVGERWWMAEWVMAGERKASAVRKQAMAVTVRVSNGEARSEQNGKQRGGEQQSEGVSSCWEAGSKWTAVSLTACKAVAARAEDREGVNREQRGRGRGGRQKVAGL